MRSTRKPNALQQGFTLIEAMTAGLVLSIITIGLMSAWTVAGANVNDLVVREKAIWTLNGHMERISALYQFTDFGAFGVSTSTGYNATTSDPDVPTGAMPFGPWLAFGAAILALWPETANIAMQWVLYGTY